jgi:hypothetical protein
MTDPITPPPELVQQWIREEDGLQHVTTRAAQWAADQELEACCKEMKSLPNPLGIPFGEMVSNALRAARRPKPSSLKEQALASLAELESPGRCDEPGYESLCNIIRRALEVLPND